MANPSKNLPPTMQLRQMNTVRADDVEETDAVYENLVTSTVDNSKRGESIEDPITGCSLLLNPDDTEAVLTLVMMQNRHRFAVNTSQALSEQNSETETSAQDNVSSLYPLTDSSSGLSSNSIKSCSSNWSLEKTDQDNDVKDESSAQGTSSEKPTKFDCDQCGKYYATSSNLSRHKQTHRNLNSELAQRCRDCNKVYVSMSALAMHMLTHRMRHACRECGKQFSRPWLLRGHLRLHTGEKPYKCIVCGKTFADRSNLRAHLQTHSPDKKFECIRCNKTFALKTYLNKHRESACARLADNN